MLFENELEKKQNNQAKKKKVKRLSNEGKLRI